MISVRCPSARVRDPQVIVYDGMLLLIELPGFGGVVSIGTVLILVAI
jgi:hypothetical protein